MNDRYLEIIKNVMSSFGYNLTESIAGNDSDEYIITNNHVIFYICSDQSKGEYITNTLGRKLRNVGADISIQKPQKIDISYRCVVRINN